MVDFLERISHPEVFIGLVAPIGADLSSTVSEFRNYFENEGYTVVDLKVTKIFQLLSKYIIPAIALKQSPPTDRYDTYISYGNQLREEVGPDSVLAAATILRIIRKRLRLPKVEPSDLFTKKIYLIHQFKRKEEIELMRSVYGRLFFQVSIYSRRGARVDYLSRKFAGSKYTAQSQRFRPQAEELIQRDENETEERHGQRIAKIFHDADFIINLDVQLTVHDQVHRFCELIFSSNSISPSKIEYGMFLAKAAALRSMDLSRQVGAAIFMNSGELISLGSNEVPKAKGGTYWSDEIFDARDYKNKIDSNDKRKKEILLELIEILSPSTDFDEALENKKIQDSQFMDALEYGRIVHAEMSALMDAARLGKSVSGGVLYSTTFPCHMCAKHIVSSGISKVVFLEPYPKSLASALHSDSLQIEGDDRGNFQSYPSVVFEHFYGITPRRYREIFERGRRKNELGEFVSYIEGIKRPFIDIKFPFYSDLEKEVIKKIAIRIGGEDADAFFDDD